MRRGELRLVDFEPVRGAEADKRRPAVLVSNDEANTTASRLGRGVLAVAPVTSNVEQVYPFQVLLPAGTAGLSRDSKVQAEQIRSVSLERIGEQLGVVPRPLMAALDEAVRLHLALYTLPAFPRRRR